MHLIGRVEALERLADARGSSPACGVLGAERLPEPRGGAPCSMVGVHYLVLIEDGPADERRASS